MVRRAGRSYGRGIDVESDAAVVEERVQVLAQRLLPRAKAIAAVATERCLAAAPDLAPVRVPHSADYVGESNEQYVGAALSMLAFGMVPGSIEPPPGTMKVMRWMVAREVDVTSIFTGYRITHATTWEAWADFAAEHSESAADLHAVLRHASSRMFAYFDTAATQFVTRYQRELLGSQAGRTTRQVVEAVLRGERPEPAELRERLDYDLDLHHLAVVLVPISGEGDPRAAVEALIRADGAGRPLVVADEDGSCWAWLGYAQSPGGDRIAHLQRLRLPGVVAGVGDPARGVDGFRHSHEQAREAVRIALLAPTPVGGIVRHRSVELVSLLCADPDRARAFAADRLGGLATRDEAGSRLRETVRTFLAHGSNKARTAEVLHVHTKTVAYRLSRAEEILGQDLDGSAPELEAALFIDLTLNGA